VAPEFEELERLARRERRAADLLIGLSDDILEAVEEYNRAAPPANKTYRAKHPDGTAINLHSEREPAISLHLSRHGTDIRCELRSPDARRDQTHVIAIDDTEALTFNGAPVTPEDVSMRVQQLLADFLRLT
jgi:hypothetical protein